MANAATSIVCDGAAALRCVQQGPEKEARLAALIGRIGEICGKRGVMIKPFFDDAATDDHSGERPSNAHTQQCSRADDWGQWLGSREVAAAGC